MRFVFSLFMITALAVFAACQNSALSSPAVSSGDPVPKAVDANADETPRITLADAKKEFDADAAIFIDTRSAAQFQAEHIKGAINIPTSEFAARYKEVPKDKKIIAYCS